MTDATIPGTRTLGDRYTIERVLGHGGMATVHLAEEHKHQRKVAIKVLKQEYGASVGAERFLREIGIAAQLSHPYIVPLIDSGEFEGSLYYVSPYIPGGSLRDRLNVQKKLPVDDALRITQEVGAALDYAHRNGYVHRDVKPENILFADDHALGDKQRALDWVEAAMDDRRGWVAYLRVHPIMDPLRGEPRFDALVKRMKFDTARS